MPVLKPTPLIVIAGKEYGSGSSRDWAAKGTRLLGIKAVICESFERIHRSNLVGMGVLPLNFIDGETPESLGLDGTETYDIVGLGDGTAKEVDVTATKTDGSTLEFKARVQGPGSPGHAQGNRVLPPRRHPALRAAPDGRRRAGRGGQGGLKHLRQ